MTNETVPELPDWVKVLIADARSEGYNSGRQDGKNWAFAEIQRYARSEME